MMQMSAPSQARASRIRSGTFTAERRFGGYNARLPSGLCPQVAAASARQHKVAITGMTTVTTATSR